MHHHVLAVVLAFTVFSGCRKPTCGDGRLDEDEQCDDGNTSDGDGCLSTCELPSCGDGVLDVWEACDEGEGGNLDEPDAACRVDCQLPRCGDAIVDVESGEACDDGNLESGDGCTPACAVEGCGNGVLDLGEACDDGNHLSQDGCASDCTIEDRKWRQYAPAAALPRTDNLAVLVADSRRGHVLAQLDGKTWKLDGAGWHLLTEVGPLFETQPQCAEFVSRGEVVCFGGLDDRTWIWDGVAWRLDGSSPRPPARAGGQMIYDPVRDVLILHGGGTGDSIVTASRSFRDTWTFDGEGWTEAVADGDAVALLGDACAFDYQRGGLVCYGGADDLGFKDPATWTWDGVAWTRLSPATEPTNAFRAYWDRVREKVVVTGADGVWSWDGSTWTQENTNVCDLNSPLVWDPNREIWLGAGAQDPLGSQFETHTWDGDNQGVLTLAPEMPSQRSFASTAYQASRGQLLLAGGAVGLPNYYVDIVGTASFRADSWAFGLDGWQPLGSGPSGARAGMAWDRARDRVVFFPDLDGATVEWNGSQWTSVATGSDLKYAALAWDGETGAVIRTGGVSGFVPNLPSAPGDPAPAFADNETWTWDGASWMAEGVSTSPAGDLGADMAWHPLAGAVYATGGVRSTGTWGGIDQDVWTWDGADWSGSPARGMPESLWSSMAYDPHRQRMVRTGGASDRAPHYLAWELTEELGYEPFALAPSGTVAHTTGWHALHRRLVVITTDGETWLTGFGPVLEGCTTGFDGDGDGLVGCEDPDCWGFCEPECPPDADCDSSAPSCGDGTCSGLESPRLCPEDCGAPAMVCGDHLCDSGEACPGDCP